MNKHQLTPEEIHREQNRIFYQVQNNKVFNTGRVVCLGCGKVYADGMVSCGCEKTKDNIEPVVNWNYKLVPSHLIEGAIRSIKIDDVSVKQIERDTKERDYQIKLANHKNFYQHQKDRVNQVCDNILKNINHKSMKDMVEIERKRILSEIRESEAMGEPNPPGYYRANND